MDATLDDIHRATAITPLPTHTEIRARIQLQALKLIRLGARTGLVQHLTGLPHALVSRLYREVHGRHSPPGLAPFTDTWLMKSLFRRLHAGIVWRYHQALLERALAPAAHLIGLYTLYHQSVRERLLDIARVHSVPGLVASGTWQVQRCGECTADFVGPPDERGGHCPGCQLYRRFRCPGCGGPLPGHRRGRRPSRCEGCRASHADSGRGAGHHHLSPRRPR